MICHYILPPLLRDLRDELPADRDRTRALRLGREPAAARGRHRGAHVPPDPARTDHQEARRDARSSPAPIESYLARRGTPRTPDDLLEHDLIGFDRSDLHDRPRAKRMGFDLKRDDFVVRTDSQTAMWELMKAGLGIGFAQEGLVRDTPGMVRTAARCSRRRRSRSGSPPTGNCSPAGAFVPSMTGSPRRSPTTSPHLAGQPAGRPHE